MCAVAHGDDLAGALDLEVHAVLRERQDSSVFVLNLDLHKTELSVRELGLLGRELYRSRLVRSLAEVLTDRMPVAERDDLDLARLVGDFPHEAIALRHLVVAGIAL